MSTKIWKNFLTLEIMLAVPSKVNQRTLHCCSVVCAHKNRKRPHTRILCTLLMAALLAVANPTVYPPVDGEGKRAVSTLDYCLGVKRSQVLVHATIWVNFFFKKRFWLFMWETEHKWGGGWQRERERDKLLQTPCWVWSPTRGSISQPWDHDLLWNQESDAQPTEPPRSPNVGELWKPYAEWKKPDMKVYIYMIKFIWILQNRPICRRMLAWRWEWTRANG